MLSQCYNLPCLHKMYQYILHYIHIFTTDSYLHICAPNVLVIPSFIWLYIIGCLSVLFLHVHSCHLSVLVTSVQPIVHSCIIVPQNVLFLRLIFAAERNECWKILFHSMIVMKAEKRAILSQ